MARVLKVAPVIAALLAVAVPAGAQLITQHLNTDADMLSVLSDTLFVGEVMKATKGAADPKAVRTLLTDRLEAGS